ncbi:hypothetical protein, partial [Capnocytophaga sp. oral taxon 326]|uniref:hypothetical protein n=1 Tax=Capnocytophaga sp. oral taxon 326 TaxID=712212 RepID=UPI001E5BEC87
QHYVNVRVVSYLGRIALLCEWANCLFCVNGRIAIRPYKCLIISFAGAKVRRFFKLANFLRVFFKIFLIYFLSG